MAEVALTAQVAALREQLDMMRAQVADAQRDRDRWAEQAQAITRQLADATVARSSRRPWWKRLAG
jgi:hypothetical protein